MEEVIVCGGGANPTLMSMLEKELAGPSALPMDRLGINADAKEAISFALLAAATWLGLPGNVPTATGESDAWCWGRSCPAGLTLLEHLADVSRAMHNTKDSYSAINWFIKNDVVANGETSQVWKKLCATSPNCGVFRQHERNNFHLVEPFVGRDRIVRRDISPYLYQV